MEIRLHWQPPLPLVRVRVRVPRYECDYLDEVPDQPGIYVFGRIRGSIVEPLYIGLAKNLSRRVRQHLRSNASLMAHLYAATAGRRVLLVGELVSGHGKSTHRVLRSIERAMIRYAMGQGCDILNKHGARRPAYQLRHEGNRKATAWMPRRIDAEQLKAHRGRRLKY